jgi:hypothetical protein
MCQSGVRPFLKKNKNELTSFPFRERYVTSRFVLDKLDLNLAPSRLLLGLGTLLDILIVVVTAALCGIMVVDESILDDGGSLAGVGLGFCWSNVSWVHVECALAFAHIKLGRVRNWEAPPGAALGKKVSSS